MDFTEQLKKDIIENIPKGKSARLPFLAGVTKNCAYIELYKKSVVLTYEFSSKEEAVALLPIIRDMSDGEVFFVQKGAQGENAYRIQLKDDAANKLLESLRLSRYGEKFVADNGVEYLKSLDTDTFFYYLRGVALVTARLRFADEEYSNYSLQFTFADKEYCLAFRDKMESLNIELKESESKTGYTLMSRNSSDIADMLAMCQANNCVLELNNILVDREQENQFNRISNFYMANYKKSMASIKKYTDAIMQLEKSGELEFLDKKLKNIAVARLYNSEDSMQELADRLSMSKTSLSRALNKILAIAEGKTDGRE